MSGNGRIVLWVGLTIVLVIVLWYLLGEVNTFT